MTNNDDNTGDESDRPTVTGGSDGASALPTASPVSRRRFLSVASVAGAATAGGAGAGYLGRSLANRPAAAQPELVALGRQTVAFHGARQAGIVDRAQARGLFIAFDLAPTADRATLRALMRRWTDAAARLTQGEPFVSAGFGDAGEDDDVARGSGPASLTVTFGFGPALFDRGVLDQSLRPAALAPLPGFTVDRLDPARGGGDLLLQVGADDALVAFHAARTLTRLATEPAVARVRWQMTGFNRSPGAGPDETATPRNLMGQIDGTHNPKPADPDFDRAVFVAADANPAWMRHGSYLVFRRIRMLLNHWDRLSPAAQERVIGRRKATGAPLTGGDEHSRPDFGAQNPAGGFVIPPDAHIRLARAEANQGAAMLRRAFSYDDGLRPDGTPDAGLLFVAWQADPARGFVPVQRRLARAADALNRFTEHETSALFAVPGGCLAGGYVGQALLNG